MPRSGGPGLTSAQDVGEAAHPLSGAGVHFLAAQEKTPMKRMFTALLLALTAAACGGATAPREYVLTITGLAIQRASNSVVCLDAPDPNIDQQTPFNNDGTVFIYQGDATHWYL